MGPRASERHCEGMRQQQRDVTVWPQCAPGGVILFAPECNRLVVLILLNERIEEWGARLGVAVPTSPVGGGYWLTAHYLRPLLK